jgi:AcrR family transcriptional regulator
MSSAQFDRRGQILEKATALFSKEGYDKVTIRSLAAACGITEPALYRHFTSKEELYSAVLDSIEAKLSHRDIFEKLKDEDDIEKLLKGLARHILDFFTKNEGVYRLLLYSTLREHGQAKKVHRAIRGAYIRFLMDQLDYLYGKDLIVKKNNEMTARCFVGMIFDCALGKTLWRGFQGRVFKPADIIENNVPIYVRGLKK